MAYHQTPISITIPNPMKKSYNAKSRQGYYPRRLLLHIALLRITSLVALSDIIFCDLLFLSFKIFSGQLDNDR